MRHPFAGYNLLTLNEETLGRVTGGLTAQTPTEVFHRPQDGKSQPIKSPVLPPVYYTQALGEDGGSLPEPDLT